MQKVRIEHTLKVATTITLDKAPGNIKPIIEKLQNHDREMLNQLLSLTLKETLTRSGGLDTVNRHATWAWVELTDEVPAVLEGKI